MRLLCKKYVAIKNVVSRNCTYSAKVLRNFDACVDTCGYFALFSGYAYIMVNFSLFRKKS